MLACASDMDGRSVEYLIKHKADTSLQDKKVNPIVHWNKFYLVDMLESFNAKCHWKDDTAKGQLISKGLFDVTVSTKKPMKFFKDFCPSLQKEFKSKNFIIWLC